MDAEKIAPRLLEGVVVTIVCAAALTSGFTLWLYLGAMALEGTGPFRGFGASMVSGFASLAGMITGGVASVFSVPMIALRPRFYVIMLILSILSTGLSCSILFALSS